MAKTLTLTKKIEVSDASHIVYFFESLDHYINNLLAYIKAGVKHNHNIVIIEDPTIYLRVEKMIRKLFTTEEQKYIHYVDSDSFYLYYGSFISHKIFEHFEKAVDPFLSNNLPVRTWAHVQWDVEEKMETILIEHEMAADCSVNEMGLISVCAYPSSKVPAVLQTKIMRSHEYLMTDEEFVRSPFYKKSKVHK